MSTYSTNVTIQEEIVRPENCHCTDRSIITGSSAKAVCKDTGVTRALLSWQHKDDGTTVIKWRLPIGVSYSRTIPADSTVEEIDALIEDGFAAMHSHWGLDH